MHEGSRLAVVGHTADLDGVRSCLRPGDAGDPETPSRRPTCLCAEVAGRTRDGHRVRVTGVVGDARISTPASASSVEGDGPASSHGCDRVRFRTRRHSLGHRVVADRRARSGIRQTRAATTVPNCWWTARPNCCATRRGWPIATRSSDTARRPLHRGADAAQRTQPGCAARCAGPPEWRRHLLRPGVAAVFVQDDSAGIFVDLHGVDPGLRVGDAVDLEGTSTPGEFAPSVRYLRHVRRGTAPLPTAADPPIGELSAGVFDSQMVQAVGVVRRVARDPTSTWKCTSTCRARGCSPSYPTSRAAPESPRRCRVRVTAVAGRSSTRAAS